MTETIMAIVAHNDDHIIGAGGTLAKYAKEGKEIIVLIFSYGEMTHPHYKRKVIVGTRVKESKSADRILFGDTSDVHYLGLKEGKFDSEIESLDILNKVKHVIKDKKPTKIFTHSMDDPHPDHQSVYKFVLDLAEKTNYKGDIYSFNVWNFLLNFRKRDLPRLFVDISDTFKLKVEALNKHKSQKIVILQHLLSIFVQGKINGINNNTKFAEVFYKIR